MRNNNRVEPAVAKRFPIRQRFLPFELRVHAGVEHEAMTIGLYIVRISADLGPTRQIDEFQTLFLLLVAFM